MKKTVLFVIVLSLCSTLVTPVNGTLTVKTHFNALVLYYNPIVIDTDGDAKTVTEALVMRSIEPLMDDYIAALKNASGGQVIWKVRETFELNEFPPENDPAVTYTAENYMRYRNQGYDMLGKVDYLQIANDPRFNIVDKVQAGDIDAVWIFSFPGTGFWETAMAGEGAYWINGSPISGVNSSKKFVFYGFGHESHQHYGFMLENTGHMVENILYHRSTNWPKKWNRPIWNSFYLNHADRDLVYLDLNDWQLFSLTDAVNYSAPSQNAGMGFMSSPGNAHVGSIHFPPNATFNYGWNKIVENFHHGDRWIPFGGNWRIVNGRYVVDAGDGVKSLMHDGGVGRPYSFSDFIAEGELSISNESSTSHAGFIFRMENWTTDPTAGLGYYAAIDAYNDQVLLYKLDDGLVEIASEDFMIDANTIYRMKITANNTNIKVYLGNQSFPLIDITDTGFEVGGFGVCAYDTAAAFDNIDANVTVKGHADRWHNYPDLTGTARPTNSIDWNASHEKYLSWWFEHIPKNPGTHDNGILNTWWPYIFDINTFDPQDRYTDVQFAEPDTINPGVPTGLNAIELESHSVSLIWEEPNDNVGVTGYDVYRDGEFLQHVSTSSLLDKGLLPDTIYTYEVASHDGSGNVSELVNLAVETSTEDSGGLQNGSFEQGALNTVGYWTADAWQPADAIMTWDPTGTGYLGSRSVSIMHNAGNDSRWIQTISGLTPGKRYLLNGRIKGEDIVNVTGSIGANLCLFGTWEHTPSLNGTFDWTEVSMVIIAPANGEVVIGCRLGYWGNTVTGKAWFDEIILIGIDDYIAMPVSSTAASDYQNGHPPEDTIDNDFSSRWAANGDGQWIEYDLGSTATVGYVQIAWFGGDQRKAAFEVEVSIDGIDWKPAYSGQSSGGTSNLEPYYFNETTARYVRILGHGNTDNNWNSITEFKIYGKREYDQLPISSVSASDYQNGNPPENTIDKHLTTRWAAHGDGQWIEYDLGSTAIVGHIKIAWYGGHMRVTVFNIEVSIDGINWRPAYAGQSSGGANALESIHFKETTARYVRIVGHGNDVNNWNSITEVEVWGQNALDQLPVSSVVASKYQSGFPPEDTIDTDLDTRWAAHGDGQWIEYDLGSTTIVATVEIAWFKGDQRKAAFDIEVSNNGIDWMPAYSGQSSGDTLNPESFALNVPTARYIRIVGHGNTDNGWTSITELRIYGKI